MELFNVQFTCVSPCIRGPSRLSTILLISRTQFRCMDSAFYGQDFVTESFCCSRASLNEALADTKLSSRVIFNFFSLPKVPKAAKRRQYRTGFHHVSLWTMIIGGYLLSLSLARCQSLSQWQS